MSQPHAASVPPASAPSRPVAAGEGQAAPSYGRFSVRGRLDDPWGITWRAESEAGPVDQRVFLDALEHAMAAWSASGLVAFRPAAEGQIATVRFGWRRGEHGGCRAFGVDPATAHTGPMGTSTFVHFDAGRRWSVGEATDPDPSGGAVHSLEQAAMHELGHVLGLGHSAESRALMSPDTHAEVPTESDLAGLRSLYGRGGLRGPADLLVLALRPGATPGGSLGQPVSPGLSEVAPAGRSAVAVFDTDGDGDDELLVWRTDVRGLGALMIYHFVQSPWADARADAGGARQLGWSGPALARTLGPLLGAVSPLARTSFRRDKTGGRWIESIFPGGETRLRRFGRDGLLHQPTPAQTLSVEWDSYPLVDVILTDVGSVAAQVGAPHEATSEPVDAASSAEPHSVPAARGDLDGDGVEEAVVRAPAWNGR